MITRKLIPGIAFAALALGPAKAADAPVDIGLWEVQVTTSLAGIQITAEMTEKLKKLGLKLPDSLAAHTRQVCVTEQTLARFGDLPNQHGKCRQQNMQRSARGLSFDVACESGPNSAAGHVDVVFDDRMHVHGSATMSGSHGDGSGKTMPLSGNATLTGRWLSNSCSSAQPID